MSRKDFIKDRRIYNTTVSTVKRKMFPTPHDVDSYFRIKNDSISSNKDTIYLVRIKSKKAVPEHKTYNYILENIKLTPIKNKKEEEVKIKRLRQNGYYYYVSHEFYFEPTDYKKIEKQGWCSHTTLRRFKKLDESDLALLLLTHNYEIDDKKDGYNGLR